MEPYEIYNEIRKLDKCKIDNLIKICKNSDEIFFWEIIREYLFNEKNKPNTIYHYTNLPALDGILSEGKIRLLSSDKMNDKAEMHNFIDLLEKSVCKRLRTYNMNDKIRSRFAMERSNHKEEISYISSFSVWEDDVSQWERYGSNGYGVAIGFDYQILDEFAKEDQIMLQEVFYENNADRHKLVDALEDLFLGRDYVRHGFLKDDWEAVFYQAWGVSIAHKHFSFRSEREYRLVTLPTWYDKRNDKLDEASEICTMFEMKKYIPFDWKTKCNTKNIPMEKLIKSITIGPRSKISCRRLKEHLCDIGRGNLAKRVKKSQSTLR